ncbi:MAG: rod shape-determining protein MreD [Acidimicrobiaceae bacterium]
MDAIIGIAENKYTRLVLVGLLFLSLQTTIFNEMRPFNVCLQVMLLLAASCGLAKGSSTGAVAGCIVGLLYDFVLTTPLGLCAAVFALVAYLAGYAHSFVHESTWWSRSLVASAASAVGMVVLPIAFTVTGAEGVLTLQIFTAVAVVSLFNAVFSVPVEILCRWALKDPAPVR